jgi:hypothetical protein
MKSLENQPWLWALIISNIAAIMVLVFAIKWSRLARLLFCLLFVWASWVNWKTSQQNPVAYLEYADLTFSSFYKNIINGWFSKHIREVVGFIATCQAVIAISMILKGWIFKLGCIGGLLFLLAITPLGVGSGFPCTITFGVALIILYDKGTHFLWQNHVQKAIFD